MYQLEQRPFGPHTLYRFEHPETKNGFSIVPGAGANVLDIVFGGKSILDGYTTPEELEAGKWGKSTVLFPFPNRLDKGKYRWLGKTYQFPINNESTMNAIHGFVRDEAFVVGKTILKADQAAISCHFDYLGNRPYYPFPFSMELKFVIHDSGKFELKASVENMHEQAIPVGFGWHPYFKLSEEGANAHALKLPDCEMVTINDRMIPTGGRKHYPDFEKLTIIEDYQLDNCFQSAQMKGKYELMLQADNRWLRMKADVGAFPFFQVFTPPHRQSVALEPMSCNVDAFNNLQGLVNLPPDHKWKASMEIVIQ